MSCESQAGAIHTSQARPTRRNEPRPRQAPQQPLTQRGRRSQRAAECTLDRARHQPHRQVVWALSQQQHLSCLVIPHQCNACAQPDLSAVSGVVYDGEWAPALGIGGRGKDQTVMKRQMMGREMHRDVQEAKASQPPPPPPHHHHHHDHHHCCDCH
jgi:hypothetical protein